MQYKIFNAEVLIREDASADDLIDVIVKNRVIFICIEVCHHNLTIIIVL